MNKDEAIQVIRSNFPTGRNQLCEALETLIPELKESEDEMIRKSIIDLVEKQMPKSENKKWMIAWLEKQGEQNPADKVEPKFHEGEWVVVDDGRTGRIIECTKDFADVDLEFSCLSTSVNNIHLWTIQDAKDGDVLYTSSTASHETFIFKGLSKEGNIECYCSYDSEDKYCNGKYHFIGKPTFMLHPATNEQRNLLFSKMKEAGYKWDYEKKELNKIEYKSSWSEEDERNLEGIINEIEANKNNAPDYDLATYDRFLSLLKSLKDRVQPQPKQEWSEEDEKMLKSVISSIRISRSSCEEDDDVRDLFDNEIDWLESLKERMKGE